MPREKKQTDIEDVLMSMIPTEHLKPDSEPESPPPVATRPSQARWRSRVTINEAFQFPGHFDNAPAWINPNWLANVERKPVLIVPAGREALFTVKLGDWLVKQDVVDDNGQTVHDRMMHYTAADFEKLFMKVD